MPPSNTPARERQRRGTPLIVQSHLRWDFVWQRPQQLLTRFAKYAPVLFIEEPIYLDDVEAATLEITVPASNVYRAVPKLPAWLREDYDLAIARVRTLAISELAKPNGIGARFADPVQWFYTPMPAPAMLGAFDEAAVVYDCMDELSQFRFAHPDLVRRERMLLDAADVVFTGGRKLRDSKSRFNDNVHFFGCGVDADHFGKARREDCPVAPDLERLRRPGAAIAGYYGVIDERLDYDLIAKLASSNEMIDVVMIGPVVKVDPASLPQAPNIHWLGARDYEALPSYVRAFDVCLMPFALNEATEYINPTKTLEYMAAGRPIVSTAVADVVRNYTPVVRVARDARDFLDGVRADVRRPDPVHIAEGIEMARRASWESIVAAMNELVLRAADARSTLEVTRAAQTATEGRRGADRLRDHAGEAVLAMIGSRP
jgi:glycosyltransferase involved in cell wall biosynthesis